MRKIPDIKPPEAITPRKLTSVEQKRTYEFITPLYGGGVKTSEADPVTLVRATAVRGQLRFWWRVMRGGQLADDRPMKDREDEIWGKAYKKGDKGIAYEDAVQIVVDILKQGEPIKPFYTNGVPDYAAFPLLVDQKGRKRANQSIPDVRRGAQFVLTITYPEHLTKEIEAALWAWETFGGLGARTRRGFGALHLMEVEDEPQRSLPTCREAEQWIRDQARIHSRGGDFPPGVPHLNATLQLAVTPASTNPIQAWNHLVKKLQSFRQQKDANQRSAWPEADTIRAAAGKGSAPAIQKFPRAAFGLPIIFHFTGKDAPAGNYALNEAETEHEDRSNKERFASPLILRPFLCSGNQAVGLALLLEGSRVDLENLVLQNDSKNKDLQKVKGTTTLNGVLSSGEARTIARKSSSSPDAVRALQNETDVLQAFLKSVKGV